MATATETFPDLKVESEVVVEPVSTTVEPTVLEATKELTEEEKAEALEVAQETKTSKGGFQRRIDKLTRKNHELEERLAAATPAPKPNGQSAEPMATTEQEPRAEDFANYEELVKALAKWEIKQAKKAEEAAEEKAAENDHAKEVLSKYNESLEATRSKYHDFDDVAQTTASIQFRDAVASKSFQVCVMESDNGPEIIYWLAKNPEEVAKFKEMSPARIALEVGRISAKIELADAGESKKETEEVKAEAVEKPVSKAPAPISPVGGNSRAEKPLAELDPDEYVRKRNEDLRKQGRR